MPSGSIEDRLQLPFRDRSLLSTALTHKSAINERPEENLQHNERLEFLGDAVLGSVVAEELFLRFPDASEGSLTNMRAELVRQSSLARWARRLDLGTNLVLGRGEEARGGRDRDALLASGLEALLGAVYLDLGYERVRGVVAPLIAEALPGLSTSPRSGDPKSELQYRVQAEVGALPSYRVLAMEGPEHRPVFTVEVRAGDRVRAVGAGPSKQAAEQEAARAALEAWDEADAETPSPALTAET